MKIGFITDNYPYAGDAPPSPAGGIGTYTKIIAEALALAGHEVHVFTFACVSRLTELSHLGVTIWQCPSWSRRSEMSLPQALIFTLRYRNDGRALCRFSVLEAVKLAADAGRFDVIESPDLGGLGEFVDDPRYTDRYVVRLHGAARDPAMIDARLIDSPFHAIERANAVRAQIVTAPSRFALVGAEQRWGVALPNAHVVANPIDWRRLQPRARSQANAVFFGRLAYVKGCDLLGTASALIRNQLPAFSTTFIGPDSEWPDGRMASQVIREKAAAEGAAEAASVRPPLKGTELRDAVREHRICILPSRAETFGYSFLEAMSWGMPCVVADIPAFREIAEDRVHCLFSKMEDPADLAEKAMELLTDPALAATLAMNASKHSRLWSVEAVLPKMLAAWKMEPRRPNPCTATAASNQPAAAIESAS